MKVDLAFNELRDRHFMVLCSSRSDLYGHAASAPSAFLFENENAFLQNAVAADLPQDDLVSLVSGVLLSISQPMFPQRWVTLEVTDAQRLTLGLQAHGLPDSLQTKSAKLRSGEGATFPLRDTESARQVHDFLMQAPTPFLIMRGPEHILTFINPPYVQMVGRDLQQNLLGKSVREIFPELEGQPFFDLLDEVYRTGIPFVGNEVLAHLRKQQTGVMEDHYFDFVYHPVHDSSDAVFGVFVQAHDVTERVLARQISQSRESQLYRQWAELDTMYRTAPVGMCLVDLKQYRILKINEKLASLADESAEDLIGQSFLDVFSGASGLEDELNKVAAGDYVRNFEVTASVRSMHGVLRQWHVNFGPLRGATGEVEAITCMSMEVTGRILDQRQHHCEEKSPSAELSDAKG